MHITTRSGECSASQQDTSSPGRTTKSVKATSPSLRPRTHHCAQA
jgi:hypothetical protein